MEQILYSLSNYKILAVIGGFIAISVETFLPVLPLLAIVMANAFILGMWLGFLVSWLGSSISSILLYYLANKFSKIKFLAKNKKQKKVKKIIEFIKKQGFNTIFISYACPFIPDFFVTIASGFSNVDTKTFISGMICGKFVMFLLISYIGKDINSFFSNPFKIIIFSVAVMFSWMIGQHVNKKIHNE